MASRWNGFLAEAVLPTHYVTPGYFTDPYVTGRRMAVIVSENDDIQAIATGVVNASVFTSGMFSRPQVVFRNGADKGRCLDAMAGAINDKYGNIRVDLFAWERADARLKQSQSGEQDSVVMLDLSKGEDQLFAEFSQTRRNELRKAEKLGKVSIGEPQTDDETDQLYRIHCDWNARKGNRPDDREQLRSAIEQRENRRVFIAKIGEKVVAGSFYRFCPGGVVEYAGNFSIPEYQKFRPNDLLGWHAIKWAAASGFTHFSMGGSHLFLRRFGGEIAVTYRYHKAGRVGLHSIKENALGLGIGAYRRLPVTVRSGMKKVFARS